MRPLLRVTLAVLVFLAAYVYTGVLAAVACVWVFDLGIRAVLWTASLAGAVVSVGLAWLVSRWARHCATQQLLVATAAVACATTLLGATALYAIMASNPWRDYDTDTGSLSTDSINAFLKSSTGRELPTTAREVRAYLRGGVDPWLVLRFRVDEKEAAGFLESVATGPPRHGAPPEHLLQLSRKQWWRPSADASWWHSRGPASVFVQFVSEEKVIYMAIITR